MDNGDKQNKLDVQHQMEHLDAFFQTHLDLLGIFDASVQAVRLNPAWEQALGYPVLDLVGTCILDLIHPGDAEVALGAVAQLQSRAEAVSFLGRFRHQGGAYRWLEWRISTRDDLLFASVRDITEAKLKEAALLNSEEKFAKAFPVTEDTSERKRLERGLLQAHKMDSLGSLADGVAHDMNNILGAVMSLASSIRMSAHGDPELVEDMDAMVKACERGRNLVRSLLDFARQDLPEARVFNLNTVVKDQTSLLGRSLPTGLQLVTDLQSDLANITGDPGALSRALLNLCSNSIDAMETRGVLTIRTRNTDGHQVEVIVEDTGCGMAKEILDKALDPFFTTKQKGKGTGLGLPIVYGAVKAHRGHMELDSAPGKGTRIVLRFPASEQVLPDAATKASESAISETPGLRVLLIDDDELIQKSVSAQLRRLGHQVTIASNGHEALMKLDAGLEVDLAVLDITMPILDGAATLPHLRRLRPNLGVILATGKVDDATHALARAYCDVRLLPKPYSLGELRNEIAPWLERLGLAKSP
jgi:PAS domain S-box-containing protein